jgi:hypothetical protein
MESGDTIKENQRGFFRELHRLPRCSTVKLKDSQNEK